MQGRRGPGGPLLGTELRLGVGGSNWITEPHTIMTSSQGPGLGAGSILHRQDLSACHSPNVFTIKPDITRVSGINTFLVFVLWL